MQITFRAPRRTRTGSNTRDASAAPGWPASHIALAGAILASAGCLLAPAASPGASPATLPGTSRLETDEFLPALIGKQWDAFLLHFQLRIPDRTEMEFFDGPHTIHGRGTFDFLHRQLQWPQR